jgi:hypothetical protein
VIESSRVNSSVIGWREWVGLPDLGIRTIKAKIDTGARSSSLHAFGIQKFMHDGTAFVRFRVHPLQRDFGKEIKCEAEVLESRVIRSSTGHAQERTVIMTTIEIRGRSWPIELTLANRDEMGFRMLLGREGIRGRFLVDAGKSFYGGQPKKKRKKV